MRDISRLQLNYIKGSRSSLSSPFLIQSFDITFSFLPRDQFFDGRWANRCHHSSYLHISTFFCLLFFCSRRHWRTFLVVSVAQSFVIRRSVLLAAFSFSFFRSIPFEFSFDDHLSEMNQKSCGFFFFFFFFFFSILTKASASNRMATVFFCWMCCYSPCPNRRGRGSNRIINPPTRWLTISLSCS